MNSTTQPGETIVRNCIPLSVPEICGNEWQYVKECLDTGWVSSAGKYVSAFEEAVCRVSGAQYGIACVNGTAALQVSMQVAGVRTDDEVIVPTVTFIASVNAISYLNAVPVFMDCDDFYNIDIAKTIRFIKEETVVREGFSWDRKTNRRVSAVVPVHVFGNAVNMEELVSLCRERNIRIVEDAAESLGSFYTEGDLKNKHTGTVGDIGCYSFNGNKIITAGGGGMIITNNPEFAERSKYLTTQAKNDAARYVHDEIGYNFRMTNVNAAIGLAQIERLSEYIRIKKENYSIYKEAIDCIDGLSLAAMPNYADCNHWFYCLQIDSDRYGCNRDEVMEYLGEQGIDIRPLWQLNHRQKPYIHCRSYMIEKANEMWSKTLNIPCSTNLQEEEIRRVVEVLANNRKV